MLTWAFVLLTAWGVSVFVLQGQQPTFAVPACELHASRDASEQNLPISRQYLVVPTAQYLEPATPGGIWYPPQLHRFLGVGEKVGAAVGIGVF